MYHTVKTVRTPRASDATRRDGARGTSRRRGARRDARMASTAFADAAHARAAMEECVIRFVHGSHGALEDVAARCVEEVFAGAEARARWGTHDVMGEDDVQAYVRMVTFPKASVSDRFVARPGFQLALRLPHYAAPPAPPVEEEPARKKQRMTSGGKRMAGSPRMATTSVSASGPANHRLVTRDGELEALAMGTSETSAAFRSQTGKLERAFEKMVKATDEAEHAQKDVLDIEAEIEAVQIEQSKLPAPRLDLSDMPDFDLPYDVLTYTGDPDDRHAVLAHKKHIDREIERLKLAKEDWISKKKKDLKRKSKKMAPELKQLINKLEAAKRIAAQKLEKAAKESMHVDRIRSDMGMAIERRAEQAIERDVKKEAQRLERELQKRKREDAREEERRTKEERIAKEKARPKFPMEDIKLIEVDKRMAQEDGREPWPDVVSGTRWETTNEMLQKIEITEFLNTFGGDIGGDGKHMTVDTFERAVDAFDATQLSRIYIMLLHVALDSLASRYKSLVTLWSECLDMGTYPEILLQYAKSKFHAAGTVDEETLRIVSSLQTRTVGEWSHSEHCHVLSWLVNECLESKTIHAIIDTRINERAALSKEITKAKRAAELAKSEKDAAAATQQAQDAQNGENANDEEPTETVEDKPTDTDVDAGIATVPSPEKPEEVIDAEEQRRKEKMFQLRTRAQTIGHDRNRTAYFWNLAQDSSCIYAHHSDDTWSKISSEAELADTEKSLNLKGIRELRLSKNITAIRNDIVDGMNIAAEIAMFPASVPVKNRENIELWAQNARREVHASNYIRNALSLLIRDIKQIADVSPDGTRSGWRTWTRTLSEANSKAELLQCVLQMEETIYAMSDAPRMILSGKNAPAESIIQWTNDQLHAQNGVSSDVYVKESGDSPDDGEITREEDEDKDEIEEDAVAYVPYDNDWWELIIPSDTANAKRRLWRTDQERLIWQEAMNKASSIARLAYGVAMLTAYSRQLILALERQRQTTAAAVLKAEALEDRAFMYERGGYKHY